MNFNNIFIQPPYMWKFPFQYVSKIQKFIELIILFSFFHNKSLKTFVYITL